jgi:hypothetical protein
MFAVYSQVKAWQKWPATMGQAAVLFALSQDTGYTLSSTPGTITAVTTGTNIETALLALSQASFPNG